MRRLIPLLVLLLLTPTAAEANGGGRASRADLPTSAQVGRVYANFTGGTRTVERYTKLFVGGSDCVRYRTLVSARRGYSADYYYADGISDGYGDGTDVPHAFVLQLGSARAAKKAIAGVAAYAQRCAGTHTAHGERITVHAMRGVVRIGDGAAGYQGHHSSSYGKEWFGYLLARDGSRLTLTWVFNTRHGVDLGKVARLAKAQQRLL